MAWDEKRVASLIALRRRNLSPLSIARNLGDVTAQAVEMKLYRLCRELLPRRWVIVPATDVQDDDEEDCSVC